MTYSMYDYEKQLNDLHQKYNDESAAHQYARTMSQQRYSRDLQGMDQSFSQGFPSFVTRLGRGMGSGVRSGVFRQKLSQGIQDYGQQRNNLNTDFASSEANFVNQAASREAAYNKAVLALREEIERARAAAGAGGYATI